MTRRLIIPAWRKDFPNAIIDARAMTVLSRSKNAASTPLSIRVGLVKLEPPKIGLAPMTLDGVATTSYGATNFPSLWCCSQEGKWCFRVGLQKADQAQPWLQSHWQCCSVATPISDQSWLISMETGQRCWAFPNPADQDFPIGWLHRHQLVQLRLSVSNIRWRVAFG
jgi:hypothetical protein